MGVEAPLTDRPLRRRQRKGDQREPDEQPEREPQAATETQPMPLLKTIPRINAPGRTRRRELTEREPMPLPDDAAAVNDVAPLTEASVAAQIPLNVTAHVTNDCSFHRNDGDGANHSHCRRMEAGVRTGFVKVDRPEGGDPAAFERGGTLTKRTATDNGRAAVRKFVKIIPRG
jgi:hypothetical protein